MRGISAILECSTIKDMIEGEKESTKEMLKRMKEIKERGGKLDITTTSSQLLRAIFIADPEAPIKNVQKILSFTDVAPTSADFKSEEACTKEIVDLMKILKRLDELKKDKAK